MRLGWGMLGHLTNINVHQLVLEKNVRQSLKAEAELVLAKPTRNKHN